jgi:hypothetical protein
MMKAALSFVSAAQRNHTHKGALLGGANRTIGVQRGDKEVVKT